MKIFITGASGYIGHKLAHLLADSGHTVHALVRTAAGASCLQHENIIVFYGDVLQKETLLAPLRGCQQVYHAAAKVGAWSKKQEDFFQVNVTGTKHVLEAAVDAGVQKLVFTSTAGVFGPAADMPVVETHKRNLPFTIDYDRTKKEAEEVVQNYIAKSLPAVIVSPAKVYGPGHTSHSLTANAIISAFLKKGIAFIPSPGTYQVCFAYVDDVVHGHVQAMAKGTAGETYILGGNNVSYLQFFDHIRKLSGGKGRILAVPKPLIKAAAYAQEISHQLTGSNIRFTVRSVDHLFNNYTFSSQKAVSQLGYRITPLEEALQQTIWFLKNDTHA